MSDQAERDSDTLLRRAYGSRAEAQGHPDDDTWERLATGELEGADRATVIAHLTRCRPCADIYRTVLAVVDEARAFDPGLPATAPPPATAAPVVEAPRLGISSRLRPALALAASAVIAAGGLAFYRLTSDRVPPRAAAVAPSAPRPAAPAPTAAPALPPAPAMGELTADKPPVSLPMTLTVPMRGDSGAPARQFLEAFGDAIAPYRADRFEEAAVRLRTLAAGHADVEEVWFYLAVSELFAGRASAALDALDRAGAGGAARDEVPWIRAVALQRAGRADELHRWLAELCGASGPAREKACAALNTWDGARP